MTSAGRAASAGLLTAALTVAMVAGALVAPPPAHGYEREIDLTFPLPEDADYDYRDDYHEGRSGGTRKHQATDIHADRGTPVHAAVGGTIWRITGMGCGWSGTGEKDDPPDYGYAIYIDADDGREYSYIHLGRQDGPASEAYADGLTCGSRVERGQHIGYVGDSGFVSSGPHLHLSIQDPGVEDPYDHYDDEKLNPHASLEAAEHRGDFPGHEPLDLSGDAVPITGDWNGSGQATPGWYDRGRVYLRNRVSAGSPDIEFSFGRSGDVPIVGDWNGDGRETIGVLRDGMWYLRFEHNGGDADRSFRYGRLRTGNDYALSGDWNGDGRDTPGIVREGEWHLRDELAGGKADRVFRYGRVRFGTDVPLTGDWNGDGRDTPAIVRGSEWHLRYLNAGGKADVVFKYGNGSDTPVAGDWNSSGIDTAGIGRDDEWHLRNLHRGGAADILFEF